MQKGWFDKYFTAIKIMIMLCAYGYLAYMLVQFDMYHEFALSIQHISITRLGCLAAVFLLVFANWGLEGLKWHRLLWHLQPTSCIKATKQVLIGLTVGFFTPNRIGETAGRAMLLREGNRLQGIALMLVGVMGQTFASLVYGVVACIGFISLHHTNSMQLEICLSFGGVLLLMLSLFYFTLPSWGQCIATRKFTPFWQFVYDIRSGMLRWTCVTNWLKSLTPYLKAALSVSYRTLLKVTLYSMLRYGVYCLQYFLMLRFFDIQIDTLTALMLIPINYLAVSATPSVAFAEVGIRGSMAIIFLGGFTQNTVGVALAAISIWFINYVIPMLLGSILLLCTKKTIKVKQ